MHAGIALRPHPTSRTMRLESPPILKVHKAPRPSSPHFDIHRLQNEVGSVGLQPVDNLPSADRWSNPDTCIPGRSAPVTMSVRAMSAGRARLPTQVRGRRGIAARAVLHRGGHGFGPMARRTTPGTGRRRDETRGRGDAPAARTSARHWSLSRDWRTAGPGVPGVRRGQDSGGDPGSQSPSWPQRRAKTRASAR